MRPPVGLALGLTLLAGLCHCGGDVVVGIDHVSTPTTGDALDGGLDSSAVAPAPSTALLAVRALASGTHVAAGWIGCSAALEPACDGWIATTPSGIVEEARVAGPDGDVVRALALLGDDRVVAGRRTPAGVGGAWVARRTTTAFVWETSLAADPSRPSEARAVETAPDGTLVVAGNELLASGVERGWVARLGADGSIVARVPFGGTPSAEASIADAVTVTPQNVVYVGGSRREVVDGVERHVPNVLQYATDLTLFNSKSGLGITGVRSGRVKTLLGDRSVEVTACAEVDDGVGVVRMRDYLTDVIETRLITEPGGKIILGGCVVTDDASIILAGTLERPDGAHPWAAKVDRLSLAPSWTRTYETEVARLEAVAPRSGGGALAVGASADHAYVLAIEP